MSYSRRKTHAVPVGNIYIGGSSPIIVQSMTNTPTLDTKASADQTISIANAGAQLVRLTAQGVNHARNLGEIVKQVRARGCDVAISADIHFNPAAAFEAALHVDKVRINPGNFVDPARTFKSLSYTGQQYQAELSRIEEALIPLLDLCRKQRTALRLGVNHGSLSDRIMSRYGDTPEGMVESAMEFLRVCRAHDFNDVIISIKSSNVCVMVETVRLLVKAMHDENMDFPIHLGVTEAGDGEDGRVKSAVGIGTLLAEGIGDTIRVSLSEPPENEIPVAHTILDHINALAERSTSLSQKFDTSGYDFSSTSLITPQVIGVVGHDNDLPDGAPVIEVSGTALLYDIKHEIKHEIDLGATIAPVIIVNYPDDMTEDEVTVAASIDLGALLLDGVPVSAIGIHAGALTPERSRDIALNILQATRRRISHTEYIACPGCGRTLFDLQQTLHDVRRATLHLKGLKIGVMGCIVNGPGEMADADYGYVGAAVGNVSLYRAKECVLKNIPSSSAVDELINLIKADGRWIEP